MNVKLLPTGTATATGFGYSADATAVDDGSTHDGFSSTAWLEGWALDASSSFLWPVSTPPPGLTAISLVKLRIVHALSGAGPGGNWAAWPKMAPCIDIGGTRGYGTATDVVHHYNTNTGSWDSGGFVEVTWDATSVNPVGGAWNLAHLAAAKIGVVHDGNGGSTLLPAVLGGSSYRYHATSVYLEVDGTGAAGSLETQRYLGSNHLRMLRRANGIISISGPPELLDYAVGDRIGIQSDDRNWGAKTWERREGIVISSTWQPATSPGAADIVRLEVLDLRNIACRIWSPLRSDLGYSIEANGIARLGPDATHSRNQVAFVPRTSDSDYILAQVAADEPKWTPAGLLLEGGGELVGPTYNTFSGGSGNTFTGWTSYNGGTSGTIVQNTTYYLIDEGGFRRSARLTAVANNDFAALLSTTFSVNPATYPYLKVRIMGRKVSGSIANFEYILDYDAGGANFWTWNATAQAWQNAVNRNSIGIPSDGTTGEFVAVMPAQAATQSLRLQIGIWSGTAGDSVDVVYSTLEAHTTQLSRNATRSLLATTSTTSNRIADAMSMLNAAANRSHPPGHGTVVIKATVKWSHAGLADGDKVTFWRAESDGSATDGDEVYYERSDTDEGKWVFHRWVDTDDLYAEVIPAALPDEDDEVSIGLRWIGSDGELDYAAGTIILNVDSAHAVSVTQLSHSDWSSPAAVVLVGPADSIMSHELVTDYVYTDDEIAREMA